jgi:hypothetical protein
MRRRFEKAMVGVKRAIGGAPSTPMEALAPTMLSPMSLKKP